MAELSPFSRKACVQYRFVDGLQYPEIARKLPCVTADAARMVCNRAITRSQTRNTNDLLDASLVAPRTGRPQRIPPGSQASIRIQQSTRGRDKSQSQKEAANRAYKCIRDKPLPPSHKVLGKLNAKQVHNIAKGKEHCRLDTIDTRPIVRKRWLKRKALSKADLRKRRAYIEWLEALPTDTILLCVDKTPIDFGGGSNQAARVSAPKGETVYGEVKLVSFSKMQWAAASQDTRFKRPWLCWNGEDETQERQLKHQLENTLVKLRQRVNDLRERASTPGTDEYRHLNSLNEQVDAKNNRRAGLKIRGRLRHYNAARAYPYDNLVRNHEKGGMDFVFYAFEIYEKLLFPFYNLIKHNNPGVRVIITEDNVGLHHKARKLCAPQIEMDSIEFAGLPANSPDLHPIEHLFKDQKDELEDYRCAVKGSGKMVQLQAEREMERVWCRSSSFDEKVLHKANLAYYKALGERSRTAQPSYSNKFKDSGI